MKFKTPTFWYGEPHWLEIVLQPFSVIYELVQQRLQDNGPSPYRCKMPVICVGNITAGGSGKTPVAIALMRMVKEEKLATNPCFLTRGYGGDGTGTHLLSDSHTAKQVGDEAVLLARHAPVIVSPDRAEGAKLAEQNGFDLIIMDDGLQNQTLHKDIKLLVINGKMGFGNGKILPSGPLRGKFDKIMPEIDAFLMIGEDKRGVRATLSANIPYIEANLAPENKPPQGDKYIAFAGLGYPEKFFTTLREDCGLELMETISFPDHHPYSDKDVKRLWNRARTSGAKLITTEKDKTRLPDDLEVITLPVSIRFKDEALLLGLIKGVCKK